MTEQTLGDVLKIIPNIGDTVVIDGYTIKNAGRFELPSTPEPRKIRNPNACPKCGGPTSSGYCVVRCGIGTYGDHHAV